MSRGVNKVILIGNLGADPDVRYMPSGDAVATVSVATSEAWKDRNTGEMQERTEWHRVVFFGRLAEIVKQYLHKGSKVYVEGKLRTKKWQTQDGQDRYTTEIIVDNMQMLDSRSSGSSVPFDDAPQSLARGSSGSGSSGSRPAAPETARSSNQDGSNFGGGGDFDDDIPF